MTNQERRSLLDRFRASDMEGSILDVFKAYEQGVDLISEHEASQAQDQPVTLTGPQEQREGLRPFHAAGDIKRSAVFKDVPPNTPFNTNGMRVPIDIEKYDRQGHLVESHKSVPPGVRNLPTGPHRGDVIETPSDGYRDGGFLKNGGTVKRGRKKHARDSRQYAHHVKGQPKGSESTHLMATYEGDGKYYVAPTITTNKDGYKEQSFEEALAAGEVYEFKNKKRADRFAEGSWKKRDMLNRNKKFLGGEVENPTAEAVDEPVPLKNIWDARGIGLSGIFSGRKNRRQAKADIMAYEVANYMGEMYDTEKGEFRNESDPRAAKYIQGMFTEVGKPSYNSVDAPWSAATVSHFAKKFDPEFEGSALHADYINRAFEKDGKYRAKNTKGKSNYEVGDILFHGRGDTKNWGFRDFKRAGKNGDRYSSHSDIIVGMGTDENGTYYEVLGGNRGGEKDAEGNFVDGTQTTKIEKLYAKDIRRRYKGAMVTGNRVDPVKTNRRASRSKGYIIKTKRK